MGSHMESSSISLVFTIVMLTISGLLVCHIAFTLWRHRDRLRSLREQHNTIVHSLPMSIGMISTMSICTIVGAKLSDHLNASYIIGFFIGIFVSGIISFSFRDEIALFDGMVAGSMGGLMGVMAGTMVPQAGLYAISIFLMVLFILTWVTMSRRIYFRDLNPMEAETDRFLEKEKNANGVDEEAVSLSTYELQELIQQEVRLAIEQDRERILQTER